jgi:hypothetical protein
MTTSVAVKLLHKSPLRLYAAADDTATATLHPVLCRGSSWDERPMKVDR